MTKTQISEIRAAINAAHACGDLAQAEKLQAKLHDYFEMRSDAFLRSVQKAYATWKLSSTSLTEENESWK
jgi:hypothetical protein